jgi:ribosomal protein L11
VVRHVILVHIYGGSIPPTEKQTLNRSLSYSYFFIMINKYLEVMVKLNINAMEATSKEPIGPTLGQYGVSTDKFCEAFNNSSTNYMEKILLRTKVYIYSDKSFELKIRVPSISFFIKNSLFSQKEELSLSLFDVKRRPGFFFELYEYIPSITRNMVYTISLYLLSLDIYDKILISSLFKKIKSTLSSQGILFISNK